MPNPRLIPEIVEHIADIRNLRHDIHAHPELCFEEHRTAEVVARSLTHWGIETHRGLGGTGVIGVIRQGHASKAIGLRADMDALPIQEQNQFGHASKHPGKMHACGHDGHTAMLLGAARYLAHHRHFDGTVYLIFQPAEEEGGGANVMIQDGLFKRFPMQAVYGMHNWPGLDAGHFAISPGPVMASSNTFRIVIKGRGCHAALPHLGLDPIPVAAQIVLAFQTILTRNVHPLESGLISVTQISAGTTRNVIGDHCELAGTVRAFNHNVLDLIERRMREISQHLCLAHDMQCEFEFDRNYPPTINDTDAAAFAHAVMVDLVGTDHVHPQQPTMGAEDFAFMLNQRPGCYVFIGNGHDNHRQAGHGLGPCSLHNASYDFNDDILALGASYWVKLVEAALTPNTRDNP